MTVNGNASIRRAPARKLLVINQYYAPDVASTGQLAAELCSGLAQRGLEVHVVTGQPSYTAASPDAPAHEVVDGVHVHRVALGPVRGRERFWVRLTGYLRFLWGAWWTARGLVRTERPDGVMTFHNPPAVGIIGAYLARRHGLRYTYVLYDIHPDILIATRWIRLPGLLFWMWERVHRRLLRCADAIIVLGDGMKRTLTEGKAVPPERVHVIPLWGRPELEPDPKGKAMRRELRVEDDELLLLYSGNMGVMHTLDPILDAAALLQGLPVRFVFVGDGARRQHLVNRVRKEGLSQVDFLPFQSEARFVKLLGAADACLVALQPGMERLAVPCRSYTFLSAARALITLMAPEADIARLVKESSCGWNVTTGRELAALLRRLLGTPQELVRRGRMGRRVYENRFRQHEIIERYATVLRTNGR